MPNALDVLVALGSQMPTPDVVVDLFCDDMVILAWLHFLVMDTFIGRYIWMRMLAQLNFYAHFTMDDMGPIGLIAGILATSDVKDDISIPSITQNEQTLS